MGGGYIKETRTSAIRYCVLLIQLLIRFLFWENWYCHVFLPKTSDGV